MIKKIVKYFQKNGLKDTIMKILIILIKPFLKFFLLSNKKIKIINHKNKFKKIKIDTTYFNTELCELGKKYKTDKSPYNLKHRHAYTGIYHFLFSRIKDEKLYIAEIGFYENEGLKMFREYFKNAILYGYDIKQKHIDNALKDNLQDTKYLLMDVNSPKSIKEGLSKSPEKFDIIIDDSSHIFEHQIKIIENSISFLKKGGFLIIEDIFNNKKIYSEENYYKILKNLENEFSEIYFIQSDHINRYSPLYDNDKLLIMIKS